MCMVFVVHDIIIYMAFFFKRCDVGQNISGLSSECSDWMTYVIEQNGDQSEKTSGSRITAFIMICAKDLLQKPDELINLMRAY